MISTRILIRSKIIHPCHSFEKWRNYFYFCYILNSNESRLQSRDREGKKKNREKNKKIFLRKNPTHMFDLNTYQEILLFLLCHAWNCYDDRYFLFICFMISSFKKYCPNSLCVVCPKRKKKSKFRVFQRKLLTILIRLPVYMTHYLLILLFAFCIPFIPSFHYFLSPR